MLGAHQSWLWYGYINTHHNHFVSDETLASQVNFSSVEYTRCCAIQPNSSKMAVIWYSYMAQPFLRMGRWPVYSRVRKRWRGHRKPTTSKWLWYDDRIYISPPLWQARPGKLSLPTTWMLAFVRSLRCHRWSLAHQSWLW